MPKTRHNRPACRHAVEPVTPLALRPGTIAEGLAFSMMNAISVNYIR